MPVKELTCGRPRRRGGALLLGSMAYGLMICCDALGLEGDVTTRVGAVGVEETTGAGVLLRSGGRLEAFPMPLGSERTLGLAGPYGTPLIAELPAPADPAGGVSCAKACPGRYQLPSTARTSAVMRDIWPSGNFDIKVSRGFPQARLSASPVMSALGQPLGKQRALTAVFANDRQITGESYHR